MDLETVQIIGMVLGPALIAGIGGYYVPRLAPDTVISREARAFLIVAPILIVLSTTIYVLKQMAIL